MFYTSTNPNIDESKWMVCYKYGRKCKKCLKKNKKIVREKKDKQIAEMSVEDFIDLGEAYMWFLETIDPFTGALFETPLEGAEVGPTNGKIIAEQFKKLKFGDRFFFHHKREGNVKSLETTIHKNILRRTLSSVFCDNIPVKSKQLKFVKINVNAFLLEGTTDISNCKDIEKKSKLDFKSIAKEIVGSFEGKSENEGCNFDEDCKLDDDTDSSAFMVCSNGRCLAVTGECLDSEDCGVSILNQGLSLFFLLGRNL